MSFSSALQKRIQMPNGRCNINGRLLIIHSARTTYERKKSKKSANEKTEHNNHNKQQPRSQPREKPPITPTPPFSTVSVLHKSANGRGQYQVTHHTPHNNTSHSLMDALQCEVRAVVAIRIGCLRHVKSCPVSSSSSFTVLVLLRSVSSFSQLTLPISPFAARSND